MPEDVTEQRYRDMAAQCMARARDAGNERTRTMFLQLAQKWLEMASDHFGMSARNHDRFDMALRDFNERQLKQ